MASREICRDYKRLNNCYKAFSKNAAGDDRLPRVILGNLPLPEAQFLTKSSVGRLSSKLMNLDDEQLVDQLRRGSESAFSELYHRRHSAVYRFALQMTGSPAIAEDVTQETFLALLRQPGRYDAARGTVPSYLYGIARNQVRKRIDPVYSADDCNDADPGETVLEELSRRETVTHVRQAVLSLPTAYREVVVLCDLHETSYEDAAMALGCPIGTVRSRLNRGRGLLAQKLALFQGAV